MAKVRANRLSSLTSEILEEILYRTPVESLLRFKTTCKQWYTLITSNKFKYNHLDHYNPERFIRIDDDRAVQIMDPVTGIRSETPIPDEFHHPLPVSCMVHCDGLLLCRCEDWNDGRQRNVRLAVWNPALRKIKWIEPLLCYWVDDYFGIGYDKASRANYKILRFGDHVYSPSSNTDRDYEIYEFESDSWRRIEAEFDADIDMEWECVSVKGNMYWIATKVERDIILCFDFSMETFKDICLCPHFWAGCSNRLECLHGDRLSLLSQDGYYSRDIEVWMTNKLSDEVISFTKYFNVVTSPNLPRLQINSDCTRPGYSIGKHRNIMAWCEGAVEQPDQWYSCFTLYGIVEGGLRTEIETGRRGREEYSGMSICSYVYVPSLIPVPE